MEERKTNLAELKVKHPFDNVTIARIAEVNPIVIYWMLTRKPVARWQAVDVLKVLSLVKREKYSLDTVKVVLHPETVR